MKKRFLLGGIVVGAAALAGAYFWNKKSENPITEEDVKKFVNKEKKNLSDFAVKSEDFAKTKYNNIKDFAVQKEDILKEKIIGVKESVSFDAAQVKKTAKNSIDKMDEIAKEEISVLKDMLNKSSNNKSFSEKIIDDLEEK